MYTYIRIFIWLFALASLSTLASGYEHENLRFDYQAVFVGEARARDPIHFAVGTGFNAPTTFDAVREFAIGNGIYGMESFTEGDWLDVDGRIVIIRERNETQFILSMDGLVPGGLYTAWLVRKPGSPRGSAADLDLGRGYQSASPSMARTNAIFANKHGVGYLRVKLNNRFADANGFRFVDLNRWDEIHIAFHADDKAYGSIPGPNHWTQIVFPIR